jgi:hypothetical protein
MKGNAVEIQTSTYWNVIDGSMTALLACVIVQQYSSATSLCPFLRARKYLARVSKMLYHFFYSWKNCVSDNA